MDVGHVAEYGVAIFAMGCLLVVVLKQMTFMKTHIRHSTESNVKLACAINQMLTFLENRK